MSEQAEAERAQQRMFPIQGGPAIPWVVIAPCDRQCQRNHGGQTLEHIAERGGLGVSEAIDVLIAQRWGTTELRGVEAQDALAAIIKDRWYLPEVERLTADRDALRRFIAKHDWQHTPDAAEYEALTSDIEHKD